MRTRREQVQAYRFTTRRIVSAMLSGEPETTDLPMRRLAYAVFASVMVAAIVFAGVGIYGLLNPGGRRPAESALIIERETGARYLYLQGRLHPVLNYTSARLILGQPNPPVRTMSRRSLTDLVRGQPVGIRNAPDALPDKASLVGLPWSVCSARRSPTSITLATQVFVGQAPAGGAALGDRGLLVGVDGDRYLVWDDHRLRIRTNVTLAALEWTAKQPVPVGPAFLNALPPGPDLVSPVLPEAGRPGVRLDDGRATTIGELFRAGNQHYVMLSGGLAPIGAVTARLWPTPPIAISAQQAGRILVETRLEPTGMPSLIPDLVNADGQLGMVCAGYRGAAGLVTVETFGAAAAPPDVVAGTGVPGVDGVVTADVVVVPGGHGALVSSLSAPGSTYLVTDQGIKYPLPRDDSDRVRGFLGYRDVRPVPVPASILALIPTGPSLDPRAATLFAPPPTVGPVGPVGPVRPSGLGQ